MSNEFGISLRHAFQRTSAPRPGPVQSEQSMQNEGVSFPSQEGHGHWEGMNQESNSQYGGYNDQNKQYNTHSKYQKSQAPIWRQVKPDEETVFGIPLQLCRSDEFANSIMFISLGVFSLYIVDAFVQLGKGK
jgi:hypothetical protein